MWTLPRVAGDIKRMLKPGYLFTGTGAMGCSRQESGKLKRQFSKRRGRAEWIGGCKRVSSKPLARRTLRVSKVPAVT